jgi:hypothetical protein
LVGSTYADPKVVAAIKKNFVPVLVDMDTETAWVAKHSPQGPPGVIWVTSEGEVLNVTLDSASAADVLTDIDDALFELSGGEEEIEEEESEDDGM